MQKQALACNYNTGHTAFSHENLELLSTPLYFVTLRTKEMFIIKGKNQFIEDHSKRERTSAEVYS